MEQLCLRVTNCLEQQIKRKRSIKVETIMKSGQKIFSLLFFLVKIEKISATKFALKENIDLTAKFKSR